MSSGRCSAVEAAGQESGDRRDRQDGRIKIKIKNGKGAADNDDNDNTNTNPWDEVDLK